MYANVHLRCRYQLMSPPSEVGALSQALGPSGGRWVAPELDKVLHTWDIGGTFDI